VPSVRLLSKQRRVSISTVLQAYARLESQGWIEPRPKSGYYVRTPFKEMIPEPRSQAARPRPTGFATSELAVDVISAAGDASKVPFGAACASPELMPRHRLNAIARDVLRRHPDHSSHYDVPHGTSALRRQIARRSLEMDCPLAPDDILITNGAMEALNLALRAVARPGDIIATEAPSYFGILQTIDALGMKAIEIPTHPREGMDVAVLRKTIDKHRVRACVVMTNCHNPLGFVMSDIRKEAMVDVITRRRIPLIEDDVYGDLVYQPHRARSAKSFDREGLVILCGSFSKTIAPGLRVGWVSGGRFQREIERLKLISTISTASLPQLMIAQFMESGGYDRHLRNLRDVFERQVQIVSQGISKYFPEDTRVSRPDGGYVLWVELPSGCDAVALHYAALQNGISISPGPIFSASGKFRNFIRLNCGTQWSERIDRALLQLGRLCAELPGR
jgi:DNA-binding transcriptional MocR family regulator